MPYFDFHLHPTMKTLFSQDETKTSPWENLNVHTVNWVVRWCSDFQYIICSQSNLSQLTNTGANLVCIALIAPERGITEASILLKQAKGPFSKYLDPARLAHINDPAASPYELVSQDVMNVLLKPERFGVSKKVIVLNKGVKYEPENRSAIYVVFTIEGAHSLGNNFHRDKISAADVIRNLDDLIVNKRLPVLSLNLTHLEQNNFCNHAFGMLFVNNEEFKPTQHEVSDAGINIILECYKRKVLIDLKHMSLGARRFLIEHLRERNDFKNVQQPLVCTHAGFTGLKYADIPDYLDYQKVKRAAYGYILWNKPKRYQGRRAWTSFNPTSINLYDDDIIAILRSGGMIGLSLDKRILGFSESNTRPDAMNDLVFEEEYISNAETQYFLTKKYTGKKMNEANCITVQEVLEGGDMMPDAAFNHLHHFMSHILHLARVASDFDYPIDAAFSQVCIGSDFDGFINPVWCCPTIESMPAFKAQFIEHFPDYAKINEGVVQLPSGFNADAFAEQLFFTNGMNFVLKRIALL